MILASIGNTLIRQIGLMQMKVFLQNVSINMIVNTFTRKCDNAKITESEISTFQKP